MSPRSRLVLAAASLALLALAVLPLWEVQLVAPQYPEGLGIRIHVNTVTGIKPNDLNSINGLNHYIGMKTIEPDAIPELRYMPLIVGTLLVTGLGVAALGSRRGLAAWLGAFTLLGAAGLWDFHRWEWDYGHNLSAETAIITIPGMTYEPPMLGSKQLLNFTATSWPASGTWVLALVFGLAFWAYVSSRPRQPGRAA